MNKRTAIILGYLLIALTTFSQEIELDIHKHKLAYFLKIEQTLSSERIENKSQYISEKGVAQPIQFKRKQNGIPDLICQYFYFQSDSTMNYILYEWDEANFHDKNENIQVSPMRIDSLIEKYKELYAQISKTLGESKCKGSLNDRSKIAEGDFEQIDTWKPNDSTEITSYIDLSSKYEKTGAFTIRPTYRIMLYVTNRNKKTNVKQNGKPDENKIEKLDSVLKTFTADLHDKNFDKAKLSLSVIIADKVTTEQFEQLRANIKFGESMVIFLAGMQIGMDGSTYTMIQYKYDSDTSSPPKELIKVTFDGENKILAIDPLKRM